ncbi:hypothetical protein QTI91_13690 [Clostridium perfringens]|nr:hypothetical protein [Clostridium perfringens]
MINCNSLDIIKFCENYVRKVSPCKKTCPYWQDCNQIISLYRLEDGMFKIPCEMSEELIEDLKNRTSEVEVIE